MSKTAKIVLTIVVVIILIIVGVIGLLFRWGKQKIDIFTGEDSIIDTVQKTAEDEDFEFTVDEEEGVEVSVDEEEGVEVSQEEDGEKITVQEEQEGEVKDAIKGVPLPEVPLSSLMQKEGSDGNFTATYKIQSDKSTEEIKSSYKSKLKDKGWSVESEGFQQDEHFLILTQEEGATLSVYMTQEDFAIEYKASE